MAQFDGRTARAGAVPPALFRQPQRVTAVPPASASSLAQAVPGAYTANAVMKFL